ncbi:glutathione S-transferase N-terminal domain-containing protein [Peptoniphilus sp. KCTC 25270]|uniref:glutaredoxin family protein n=1 Tax=Peptoniphilus sp. KCTC 25270 TaxID=2897414 RepID=UPI001E3480A3|nr:glutathione S-transferase N-terminal domain-containing protein [Peptoniphilus sp. KCTC 25270]MCD1146760.1 glutathione S-transferase N-terminal domain-containing protein [Peptoniphilus sp. KCTC 25270]
MSKYTLYAATYCPYCKKVEAFIEEKGLGDKIPVEYIDKSEEAKEALIAGGGKKQVPCLKIDEEWMYESNDIINYIEKNLV